MQVKFEMAVLGDLDGWEFIVDGWFCCFLLDVEKIL